MIRLKRAYEPVEKSDGFRVLVDRLWPRGLTKSDAGIGWWLKEIAPSTALRKWFNHDPERWNGFQRRYNAELKRSDAVNDLAEAMRKHKTITLVYSAKDEAHNQAVALKDFMARSRPS